VLCPGAGIAAPPCFRIRRAKVRQGFRAATNVTTIPRRKHMRRLLLTLLFFTALTSAPAGAVRAQQKTSARCEQAPKGERNWEMLKNDYVYFDYVLCPPGLDPPSPLVRVWLTTKGDGISVEKWEQGRDGADLVAVFHGKKKAYTLYRDLAAVPLNVFKAERRSNVPAETAARPFLQEGSSLIPAENLTPESAARVAKAFENADVLVRRAQGKVTLLRETARIEVVVDSLDRPLKAQD
jgi:hypothetical protein